MGKHEQTRDVYEEAKLLGIRQYETIQKLLAAEDMREAMDCALRIQCNTLRGLAVNLIHHAHPRQSA